MSYRFSKLTIRIPKCVIFLIAVLLLPPRCEAQGLKERKVLSSSSRTTILSEPEGGAGAGALRLISEKLTRAWRSREGDAHPLVFIFQLGAVAQIDRFIFMNSENKDLPGVEAREVEVEISNAGPDSEYVLVGTFILDILEDPQELNIASVKAQWVRLTIHSNHGHAEYTELGKFEAWGKFDFQPELVLSYFIGILGMALLLAAFSRYEHMAFLLKVPIRKTLKQSTFRRHTFLGGLFVAAGFVAIYFGSSTRTPLLIGYGVVTVLTLGLTFIRKYRCFSARKNQSKAE